MTARPWMKFYPPDWRSDPALRACSLAARGLWMEMLCIMHEATPRGHLLINGKPPSNAILSRIIGVSTKSLLPLLRELEEAAVFGRNDGIIFSRRMVRDEEKSKEGKEHIEKRWGKKDAEAPIRSPSIEPERSEPRLPISEPITLESKSHKPEKEEKECKQKRVARKIPLPEGWEPSEVNIQKALALGWTHEGIFDKAEDVKIWAISNHVLKAGERGWSLCFDGIMRRDAPKKRNANGGMNGHSGGQNRTYSNGGRRRSGADAMLAALDADESQRSFDELHGAETPPELCIDLTATRRD